MDAIGESILLCLHLFDDIGTSLVNKGVHDSSLENSGICIVTFSRRILVHIVRGIEQFGTTINTELVILTVLFRITVPTVLVALVINHLIDVFLRSFAYNLGDLVATNDGSTGCQRGKIAARGRLFGLPRLLSLLSLFRLLSL